MANWLTNNSNALLQGGLGLLSGQTPQQQAAMGAAGFAGARQQMQSKNATLEYLKRTNPQLAQLFESGAIGGKEVGQYLLQAQMPGKSTAEIQNFEYGQKNPDFAKWQKERAYTRGAELGLSPVYGQDEDGNLFLGQLSKTGGVKWDGTPNGTVTPVSPEQLAQMKARGTKLGGAMGEAEFSVPSMRQTASLIDFQIKDLKNDPFLPNVIGPIDSRRPHISGEAERVKAKIAQLQGGAFLQARQLLKGGGQITDYEGARAENAFVRMNQAQDEASFMKALDDFNAAVQEGLRKLEAQVAGQDYQPEMPQQQPSAGGVVSYKDFFGAP